jgi:hypothetical protein
MADLNDMYAHYLIEERIRQHPSVPAPHHDRAARHPESTPFRLHFLSRVNLARRSAPATRLQEYADVPGGRSIATTLLANTNECVA